MSNRLLLRNMSHLRKYRSYVRYVKLPSRCFSNVCIFFISYALSNRRKSILFVPVSTLLKCSEFPRLEILHLSTGLSGSSMQRDIYSEPPRIVVFIRRLFTSTIGETHDMNCKSSFLCSNNKQRSNVLRLLRSYKKQRVKLIVLLPRNFIMKFPKVNFDCPD